jgi:GT2 family glycosyltransferase
LFTLTPEGSNGTCLPPFRGRNDLLPVLDLLSTTAPQTRHTVTAIIVAHDGARLLPGLVQALRAQTYPVERVVGVDTGSRDRSGAVLAELIGHDAVFGMDRDTGYGEAVAVALRHSASGRGTTTDPGVRRVEWIWLLHDDCEPANETLERLLRAASRDRSVVVLGPKVLDGSDRRVLREVGVSIDRAGRRVTGVEPGEIDQGQHDHNRAVMAVGSAGMLIRRDVWDRLGGFDQRLRLFRDDVDFCWRVHAAGLRVQVVTDAVIYHRELSARRRRASEGGPSVLAASRHPRRLDRRNALYVLAVNLPLLTMLRVMAGCVAGSLVRAGYFLLSKQLDLAAAQIYAVGGLLGHPVWLWKGRRRRARGRREGYAAVRTFVPPGRTLSRLAESVAGLLSSGPPQASGGMHQADSDGQEDEQFVDTQSTVRRIIANPGVQLFTALLVIALVAERRLLGTSPLGGGALVPAWGGASGLWQEYLAGFHAVGVGSTASAPPYLAVVAALATVLGGQAWLAVDVLLLGCVPLAGLTAYVATRRLVTATGARVWLAAAYALLPVATGAVASGRLGSAFAFTLLPLTGISAARMLTAPPRSARRAAWATGLLVALGAAFAPVLWVFGAAFAVIVLAGRLAIANRAWGRWFAQVNPLNAAIVLAAPFAVLFPWSLHLLASPSAFLTEAGVQPPGLAPVPPRPSALLLLSPGGPGLPPVWVTAGIGLAVLAALLPHRRVVVTAAGWCVALAGYLGAVAVSRASGTPAGGTHVATGWPGAALAVAALGLLIAAAPAAEWLARGWTGRVLPRRLLAGAALIAAATAPLLVAGYWVKDGVQGPVGSVSAPVLPAFVSASSAGGTQYRTLILRENGRALDYAVVRQADPTLGEPELTASTPAGQALSQQVSALSAPDGADAGDPGLVLGDFGIKWVLLPGPADPALAQRLDASVGLVPLSKAAAYDLWQVTGPVARVRVIAPDGTVTPLSSQPVGMSAVDAPAAGGTLVLAEPSGGWTATLNGTPLRPLAAPVEGWAQGFVLPAGGGKLVITRDNMARDLSLIAELIALLAVCVLALPGKRETPAAEAEAMTAVRATQHSKRAPRTAKRPARTRRGGRRVPQEAAAGQAGRGNGPAWRAGLAGRAAALGPGRRRSEPSASGPEEDVTTGSGVGVLADTDEGDQTARWEQPAPWESDPRGTSWDTGPHEAWGSGPQPTWRSGPQQALGSGPQPAWDSGPQPAWDSGPREPWDSGPREPWDSGPRQGRDSGQEGWDGGPGTGPRAAWPSGPQPTARQPGEGRPGPERNERAERHSHRASRRGRPGRRRGSGDRSGSDEES